MATFDDILIKLEKLNKLDDITESIRGLATIYEEIIINQQNLESRLNLLTDENTHLKNQIEKVNCELDRMKQHTLNSNIEIAGVPETDEENAEEISHQILTHLGFTEVDIIKNAYRKKGYKNRAGLPKPIIVTIRDKGTRDQILKKKRGLQTNLCTDILTSREEQHNNNQNRIIYLNEHLTDHNKYLFKRTKDLRRSGKIYSTWVRNGYILIKETDNSLDQRITTFTQINELDTRT